MGDSIAKVEAQLQHADQRGIAELEERIREAESTVSILRERLDNLHENYDIVKAERDGLLAAIDVQCAPCDALTDYSPDEPSCCVNCASQKLCAALRGEEAADGDER